jgi:hypothetical protein
MQNGGRSSRPPFCICLWVGLLLLGGFLGCLLDDFLGCFLGCHVSILPIDKTTMLQDLNMQLTNV